MRKLCLKISKSNEYSVSVNAHNEAPEVRTLSATYLLQNNLRPKE